jgi:apolipoprotein N-acyltransferase
MKSRWPLALLAAIFGGLLLSFSYAPYSLGFTAWFALIPLFWAIQRVESGKAAAIVGFAFGFAFWLASIHWVYNVISGYSDLPFFAAVALMLLLLIYLALVDAAIAFATFHAHKRFGLRGLFLAPVFWVVAEYFKTYSITGFPWNLIGYSQVGFLPAIQIADITGVYGVTALVVLVNATLALAILQFRSADKQLLRPLIIASSIIIVAFGYGFVQLSLGDGGEDEFQVALIQDDLDNGGRLSTDQNALFEYYVDASRQAAAEGADVILWGEGSLLFLDMWGEADGTPGGFYEQYVLSLPKDDNFWLLMGSNDYIAEEQTISNIAITIAPDNDGKPSGRYAKNHLTPFGEYVPFTFIFGWVSKMVPEISSFVAGESLNTMPLMQGRVGTAICYEIIFPDLVRRFAYQGATVLATISNDAWFGRSAANDQHFDNAIMRAVENRRYLLRCAVSGVSGIVTPTGNVTARSETYIKETVTGSAAMRRDVTFYSAFGDVFAWACILLAFGGALRLRYAGKLKKLNRK